MAKFYTITNLQGSQTKITQSEIEKRFYTITNLQGSQTQICKKEKVFLFYTITNLQGSQTVPCSTNITTCFTPLQTYKVLKRCTLQSL